LVVVVRNRGPLAVILIIISILSLISILVLFLLMSTGKYNGVVLIIPGFPLESIVAGLLLGLFLIAMMRSVRRKASIPQAFH
jgi:hypothetical protein